MMKFTSSDDLARLPETDPAYPVISKLVDGLITDVVEDELSHGLIIALAEHTDTDTPLSHLSFDGVTKLQGMYITVLLTRDKYRVVVIPDADWVSDELRQCIEPNLNH